VYQNGRTIMTDSKVYKTLYQLVKNGDLTPEEFSSFIKSAAMQGVLEAGEHVCIIPKQLKDELNHITESFKAVGDGDIGKGIERAKINHDYITSIRKLRLKIGDIVLKVVISAITVGLVAFFWDNIKGLFK
jgi:hypothetical protein